MTDAGFPPAASECKHMQQVSAPDEQHLMTQRRKETDLPRGAGEMQVQQPPQRPSHTVWKDRLNPPYDDTI